MLLKKGLLPLVRQPYCGFLPRLFVAGLLIRLTAASKAGLLLLVCQPYCGFLARFFVAY